MGAKRKKPMTGSYVVIEHKNSSQTYLFDGTCLIDSVTNTFVPENNESWEKYWDTTKWRYANENECKAYIADLYEHGFYYNVKTNTMEEAHVVELNDYNKEEDVDIDKYFSTVTIDFNNEYPCGVTFRCESDKEVAYKAEIVRLWKLLEEVGIMADLSINGCDKLFDSKMGKIGDKAMLRFKNVKSDGYNLFLGDEQLTNNKHDYRIYDYGK
jgi:hypothetical protein